MGGLLHLFDYNPRSMTKKFLTHNTQYGGLEAPRNSLELPVETSQCYSSGDHVLLSYQVEKNICHNKHYPSEASMKKLIEEEIYNRRNTTQYTPSVVARLMGMDMLPADTKLVAQPIEKTNRDIPNNFLEDDMLKKRKVDGVISKSKSSKQLGIEQFHHNGESDPHSSSFRVGKSRRREHPQEEELQKFKKEFEAWQAARFSECSKVAAIENIPRPLLSQENQNKEKTFGETAMENLVGYKGHTIKAISNKRNNKQNHEYTLSTSPIERNESFPSRNKIINRELQQLPLISDLKRVKSFSPTRIVILKPGPDRIGGNEDSSWTCSTSTLEERGSIEDFLEEVKERLKCELQGKAPKRSTVARGSGTETPFSENPSDPKQIAQKIARHGRQNVGMNLPRSESTRSYRNEAQFNGQDSPEFINRDTRKLLSERLRNVLKNETYMDNQVSISGYSGSSLLDTNNGRFEHTQHTLNNRTRVSYWDNVKDGSEIQTRSFRHGSGDDWMSHKEVTPRNLTRSLSAPVSGTSFGKLLLEDRHVVTGAHIRRKHEEIVVPFVKKQKKERFNIRQKVSNIRYSFTLKGKLFRRKIQSASILPSLEDDLMKDIMSGPTVIMKIGDRDRPENSTEVPPSPASVCSSVNEEFWRPAGSISPVSTADVRSVEDDSFPHVFREISSNLNALRRQLNELESSEYDTPIKRESFSDEVFEIEDPIEAYIRDLLVASGLYGGSFSKYDHLSKPICNKIFEKVEESFKDITKESKEDYTDNKVDHKLLFDLLNEAISTILGPPITVSKFRRKIIESSNLPLPCGKKLLNLLWEIICVHLYPSTDKLCYMLDNMVAWDLRSNRWTQSTDDENQDMGRDIEHLIFGDLIEETVKDLKLRK